MKQVIRLILCKVVFLLLEMIPKIWNAHVKHECPLIKVALCHMVCFVGQPVNILCNKIVAKHGVHASFGPAADSVFYLLHKAFHHFVPLHLVILLMTHLKT